ncbi:hypothetical protein GGI07_004504 [Coemansia sp. Benny D115]|nr:hypothetical protein GGI07_004504 [Coemansia sp. Benny D115]
MSDIEKSLPGNGEEARTGTTVSSSAASAKSEILPKPADEIRPESPISELRWWQNKPYSEKPLDGGYGWVVVASGCLMLMFSMGCVNSYGSYETYYYTHQFPDEDLSTIAWVGTLQWTAMNFVSIPAGILCERFDTRLVSFIGGLIMGVALIIASFCDSAVWKLILTQGIVFGLGASFVLIPATTIPAQWFVKHRPLAIGIVVAGSGIGGLWLTPATDSMVKNLGTSWALRITGIIVIVVNSICSFFLRNRYRVPSRDKIVDFSVMRDPRFMSIFAGVVCGTIAYFTPFFHMPSFAVTVLGHSPSFGNNLVTIINATSTIGRIATGQVASYLGNINTLAGCTLVAALSVLVLWLPFHTTGTVIACAVLYGLFCGGFIGLTPVIIADLWGVQRISTIVGLVYIASFIGGMVGAPSSGAILDNVGHKSNYKPSIAFSASNDEKYIGSQLSLEKATTQASDTRPPRWWESKSLEEKPVDGAYGWVVVASGFLMLMFSMGCVNSYGSYQTYYLRNQFPNELTSTLSWIGTLQFAVMNLFGIPSGILCERFDSRLVTFVGGLIMGVALIIASFCDDAVWKLILTQGIVFAIGASLVFIPATSIPAQWFTNKRALAVGIVVAGSGVGGLWLTPATDSMISSLGTGWSLRITGIIVFAVNSVASLFMRNRLCVASRDKVVDLSIFRDIRFLFIFSGAVCGTTAYFTPLFSLPSFAISITGKSERFGTNLITIINAASTVGRIATGQVAAGFGNINTLSVCTFVAALSILVLWLPFHATGTLIACAIVYGLFCGGFIGLLPVVMADLWGVQRIATIIGLLYIANFMGTMVGSPSSGAILDNIGHKTNFKPSIAFSGAFMMCACMFFVFLRMSTERKIVKKV